MKKRMLLVLFPIFILLGPLASATAGDPTVISALTSPNAIPAGFFGGSTAVSDTSVVVGAPQENQGMVTEAGHVYIFNTAGFLVATLTSPNPTTDGRFGDSVAVSDTSVVVGAPGETSGGLVGGGNVYIFSTTGSLAATLASPNPTSTGNFGYSVAVSGTGVVVGAPFEASGGFSQAGNAYIFSTSGSLITTLTSPNAEAVGAFGRSVAIDGIIVVVGASNESVGGVVIAGRAYVFSTFGSLIATLISPQPQDRGFFGFKVGVSDGIVVVGAFAETSGGFSQAGNAYTFNTSGSLITRLTSPDPEFIGSFGESVSVSDGIVVVGAPFETSGGFSFEGHGYVFNPTGSPMTVLTSPKPQDNGWFGYSVAVSGTSVLVGAAQEVGGFFSAGEAYLFDLFPAGTSTFVSCSPATVAVNQATLCTATVTDMTTSPTPPTGFVTLSSSGSGSFTPSNICMLLFSTPSTSSCALSISYTPGPGSEGVHVVAGAYSGDGTHLGSLGSFSLTVTKRTTSTSVACSPSVAAPSRPATCSATIIDASPGTPMTPTGTVAWGSSRTGTLSSTACFPATVGTLTCIVGYTPSPGRPSLVRINATYVGDIDHTGSLASTTIVAL